MAFKLVVLSCLMAFAHGSVVPAAAYAAASIAAAPVAYATPAVAARLEEFDVPQYRFGYDVSDSLTGDYKSQTEERDGDLVRGQYSFVESDGTRRVVDYAADPVNGFNAVVRNEPLVAAAPVAAAPVVAQPAPAPVVARYAAPAPVFARYATAPAPVAAPVAAPAPVFARYAAAPVARYASAPVVAARYAAPVAAAYRAAYTAPVAAAYPAPVAAAYSAPVAASYPAAAYSAAYTSPVAYNTPFTAAYPGPYTAAYTAPVGAPLAAYAAPLARAVPTAAAPAAVTTVRAAPAKLVQPTPAAGYRYPLVVVACLVAGASAGLVPSTNVTYAAPAQLVHAAQLAYAAPVTKVLAPAARLDEYDAHPQYSFAYDVQDGVTGDSKSQHESRDGDVVQGSYSVVDPDGTKRTVDYTADPHNGFNALVHREPVDHVAKVVARVTYDALVTKIVALVSYAASPVVHHAPAVHAVHLAYVTYSALVYHH